MLATLEAGRQRMLAWRWFAMLGACVLAGCIYDVPVTASATRNIDARLIGDWTSEDGKENLKVRELTGTTYLLLLNGDPFRAYHSDFAGVSFVTVQDLNGPERKYAYLKYALSADGRKLTAWSVNSDTIPGSVRTSGEARRLLRQNLANPKLYVEEPLELVKRKTSTG
jgi:hypothetical protein